jgi:hypothetical protein
MQLDQPQIDSTAQKRYQSTKLTAALYGGLGTFLPGTSSQVGR